MECPVAALIESRLKCTRRFPSLSLQLRFAKPLMDSCHFRENCQLPVGKIDQEKRKIE